MLHTLLLDLFFSHTCANCHNETHKETALCPICLQDFPFIPLTQPNLLFTPKIADMFELTHCHGLVACGWYEGPLKHWLSKYKFSKRSYYLKAIRQVIQHQLTHFEQTNTFKPDVYLILPLHTRRLVDRGYNQVAQSWAPSLPAELICWQALKRVKHTQAQSSLNKRSRKANLKHAFAANVSLTGKKVALIDDVITTGATLNAAAQTCLAAGAQEVWAYCTALTPLHR